MNEDPTNKNERERKRKEIIALAMELSESQESFPFPGIDPEAYLKLKAEGEEFPGSVTPIDDLVKRFENEGIKVVSGEGPERVNFFVLPSQSDDTRNDGILPEHLQISEMMDERLKKFIKLRIETYGLLF